MTPTTTGLNQASRPARQPARTRPVRPLPEQAGQAWHRQARHVLVPTEKEREEHMEDGHTWTTGAEIAARTKYRMVRLAPIRNTSDGRRPVTSGEIG
jgi:hypothetical protein